MNTELFEQLGLSPNEAKMYLALVEKGEASVSSIALSAGIHRRNAYDAIHRLIDKGLVFEIFSSGENLYNAADPDKLSEILAERQEKLAAIIPDLKKKFGHRHAPEEAYIYRGLEGQKNVFRDVLRVGKDSYFIGAKGAWYDSRLDAARAAFFREANRKGIRFIQLFDHEVGKLPDFPKYFEGKLEHRFLPKEYSTSSAIHIFGDYVVTYTGLTLKKMDEKAAFFIIHSAPLAESYRVWFKFLWEKSEASGHSARSKK